VRARCAGSASTPRGEVPGAYCPGDWSVNARGERKLMGVGSASCAARRTPAE
jgi:hypothetical protein